MVERKSPFFGGLGWSWCYVLVQGSVIQIIGLLRAVQPLLSYHLFTDRILTVFLWIFQDISTSNDDTHGLSNHCYPYTCTDKGYIYRYQCWVFPTTMQGFQNLKETMFQNTITIFESFLQMPHLDRQQNLWRARIWNYFSDIAAQTNMTELFQNISEYF